eukprot:gb/GECG01008505.1/.p1 GENE.gb/GECG01008505.1/~~gb/GECG01008505.1/.p1  ORF type:complete len:1631 (+),score=309.44 gb/GECG01008505.1/:1-4893(+)
MATTPRAQNGAPATSTNIGVYCRLKPRDTNSTTGPVQQQTHRPSRSSTPVKGPDVGNGVVTPKKTTRNSVYGSRRSSVAKREVTENEEPDEEALYVDEQQNSIRILRQSQLTPSKERSQYEFDGVFPEDSSQEVIFDRCGKPLVEQALEGYTCTLFAYGQTGSGKTYTLEGTEQNPGILPRTGNLLFDYISSLAEEWDIKVSMSSVELYQERFKDLLKSSDLCSNSTKRQPRKSRTSVQSSTNMDTGRRSSMGIDDTLKLREDPSAGTHLEGVVEQTVESAQRLMDLTQHASNIRATSETSMNKDSSRSHAIYTLKLQVESRNGREKTKFGKIILVDLAGSEMVRRTQATGTVLEEAKNINKSLSALGNVIRSLAEGKNHVPYRDSKLTMLLRDALGGNSVTKLLVTGTMSSKDIAETTSSMRFAMSAKQIKNRAEISVAKSIEDYQQILSDLEYRLKMITRERDFYKKRLSEISNGSLDDCGGTGTENLRRAKSTGSPCRPPPTPLSSKKKNEISSTFRDSRVSRSGRPPQTPRKDDSNDYEGCEKQLCYPISPARDAHGAETSTLELRLANAEAEKARLDSELASSQAKIAELQEEKNKYLYRQEELTTYTEQLKEEIQEMRLENEKLRGEGRELQLNRDQLQNQIEEYNNVDANKGEEIAKLKQEVESLFNQNKTLRHNLNEAQEMKEQLEARANSSEETAEHRRGEIQEVSARLKDADHRVSNLEDKVQEWKERAEEAECSQSRLQAENKANAEEIQCLMDDVCKLQSDNTSAVQSENKEVLELTRNLQELEEGKTSSEQEAQDLRGQLREAIETSDSRKNKLTLVLDKKKYLENELEEARARNQTLEAALSEARQALSEASNREEALNEEKESIKHQLRDVLNDVERLESDAAKSEEAKERLDTRCSDLCVTIQKLNDRIQLAQEDASSSCREKKECHERAKDLDFRLQTTSEDMRVAESKLSQARNEASARDEILSSLREENRLRQVQLEELCDLFKNHESQLVKSEHENTKLGMLLKEQREHYLREKLSYKAQVDGFEAKFEEAKCKMDGLTEQYHLLQEDYRSNQAEMQRRLESLSKEMESTGQENSMLQQGTERLEKDNHRIQAETAQVNEELFEAKSELSRANITMQDKNKKLTPEASDIDTAKCPRSQLETLEKTKTGLDPSSRRYQAAYSSRLVKATSVSESIKGKEVHAGKRKCNTAGESREERAKVQQLEDKNRFLQAENENLSQGLQRVSTEKDISVARAIKLKADIFRIQQDTRQWKPTNLQLVSKRLVNIPPTCSNNNQTTEGSQANPSSAAQLVVRVNSAESENIKLNAEVANESRAHAHSKVLIESLRRQVDMLEQRVSTLRTILFEDERLDENEHSLDNSRVRYSGDAQNELLLEECSALRVALNREREAVKSLINDSDRPVDGRNPVSSKLKYKCQIYKLKKKIKALEDCTRHSNSELIKAKEHEEVLQSQLQMYKWSAERWQQQLLETQRKQDALHSDMYAEILRLQGQRNAYSEDCAQIMAMVQDKFREKNSLQMESHENSCSQELRRAERNTECSELRGSGFSPFAVHLRKHKTVTVTQRSQKQYPNAKRNLSANRPEVLSPLAQNSRKYDSPQCGSSPSDAIMGL